MLQHFKHKTTRSALDSLVYSLVNCKYAMVMFEPVSMVIAHLPAPPQA